MQTADKVDEHLHTSKRMHFIEDSETMPYPLECSALAYVKTYALH